MHQRKLLSKENLNPTMLKLIKLMKKKKMKYVNLINAFFYICKSTKNSLYELLYFCQVSKLRVYFLPPQNCSLAPKFYVWAICSSRFLVLPSKLKLIYGYLDLSAKNLFNL